ncbi:SGNH/GDSL hydrolase family protein [Streptomyces sp. NPDC002490]|uniref:SGNH/GDSL hydrolase family protein n=1 Tax=Streptomyces sp. NPDC002490 TaxID=3154416 RepID=UPI00331E7A48
MRPWIRRTAAAAFGAALALAPPVTAPWAEATRGDPAGRWTGAWGASLQRPADPGAPWGGWSPQGFAEQSLRQVARVTATGPRIRVRLSHRYGAQPVRLARATVAASARGAAVRPDTLRELRFSGERETVLPIGAERLSDPVHLPVRAGEKLTVTFYFATATGPVSYHMDALTTSYRAEGDRTGHASADVFETATSPSLYLLAGIEVAARHGRGTVVAFGDSITDGYGSTPGTDRRYPDRLADQLHAGGRAYGVVNAGLSGNRLLTDSGCFGERGLARFRHEVLDRPGVRSVVVLLGINDIGAGGQPDFGCGTAPEVTADRLIEGHRALIRAAKRRGVTTVGATLTPFEGYASYHTPEKERVRDQVNRWLRTSGAYDTVVDLDRLLADPRPGRGDALAPGYDSGDGIHPNDAGMDAVAEAVADALPG